MTVEQLETVFEEFQRDEMVQNEKHRALGMFIRLTDPDNEKDVFEMSDQLDTLVQCSERQGFKYGFKAAFQMIMNKKSTPVTDIRDYIEVKNSIEKN